MNNNDLSNLEELSGSASPVSTSNPEFPEETEEMDMEVSDSDQDLERHTNSSDLPDNENVR